MVVAATQMMLPRTKQQIIGAAEQHRVLQEGVAILVGHRD